MTKKEAHAAYAAGQALRRVDNSALPDDAVSDPVAACPFPIGDAQREEWLQGYKDALDEESSERPSTVKSIDDAIRVADHAGSN